MSDRLESLHRQRALISEHLGWLDSEIRKIECPAASSGDEKANPGTVGHCPSFTARSPTNEAPELEQEVDVHSLHSEVRAGCLLYAGIAVALFAALVGFIYWRY